MKYFYISYIDGEASICHTVVEENLSNPIAFIGTEFSSKGYDPIIIFKEEIDEKQYHLFLQMKKFKEEKE